MKYYHTQSGMSLLELLLYLGIASVLVVVLSSASIAMLRTSERSERQHAVNHDMLWVSQTISRVAAGASGITAPVPGAVSTSATFAMYDADSDPTTIELIDGSLWMRQGTRDAVMLHGSDLIASSTFRNATPLGAAGSLRLYITLSPSTTNATFGAATDAAVETTLTLPQ